MLEVAGFTVSKDPRWSVDGNLLVLVPPFWRELLVILHHPFQNT